MPPPPAMPQPTMPRPTPSRPTRPTPPRPTPPRPTPPRPTPPTAAPTPPRTAASAPRSARRPPEQPPRGPPGGPPGRGRTRARAVGGRAVCLYSSVRDAEDEDPLGREEALQADRQGQGPGPARLHEPHPREEVAEAQAPPREPRDPEARRRQAGQEAPRGGVEVTRVKRSVNARKKRRATLERAKGFRGEAHSNYKRAKEAVIKADSYAYRDRRNRKRDFRRLWIVRINAAARQNGMSYDQFMHGLKLAGIELDRKVLADIAVRDPETFRRFAEAAREASAASA